MWKLKKDLLEAIFEACKEVYPDEFFALLSVKKEAKLIEEFVSIPSIFGKTHTIVRGDLMPFDKSIVGSIHSHPSSSTIPSRQDISSFKSFGEIHLIAGYPFNIHTFSSYNAKGIKERIELV